MLHELCGACSDFRVEAGESLRRAGKGATDATSSVRPLGRAESACLGLGPPDLCGPYGSSQHTLTAACFSRAVLVVSYISPYGSWVSPTVSYHLPNYPPRYTTARTQSQRENYTKPFPRFPLVMTFPVLPPSHSSRWLTTIAFSPLVATTCPSR